MSGFLCSDNVEIAGLDHTPAPLIPVPSNDADRAAFVKTLAQSAVSMFPRGLLNGAIGGPLNLRDTRPLGSRPTLPDAPRAAPSAERPVKAAAPDRWYEVALWVCGARETVACSVSLPPRELLAVIQRDGLTIEEAGGSIEWFDPASLSRIKIDVQTGKPPTYLRPVKLATKRGARS